ncbi:hypothetical protein Q644_00840 [Brucella intermedia 229E]|uniref:Uncharacterized protein n=1 Tax=Brucella intermedia 229E TaxID=1337887 RepID=U4VH31_9HYPH|nr:hypothetical protein Q644_00840 [Brucella intermedia 229E]
MRSGHLIKLLGTGVLMGLMSPPVGLASAQTFSVCHGYECYYRTKVTLTPPKEEQRIRGLLQAGSRSADGERKALRAAVAIFEQRSTATIGVRDKPKMQFGKPASGGARWIASMNRPIPTTSCIICNHEAG